MNTKRLITASIFSLISASTALAADVMIPHQPASTTASSAIVAPTFSWTGLYLGVQAGGFSSKVDMALIGQEKSLPLGKEFSPKLSGFAGGFYAGSNIDLGDNFIFGVDTDLMLSGKKHTKTITIGAADNGTIENAVGRSRRSTKVQTLPDTQETISKKFAAGVSGQPVSVESAAAGTGTTPAGTGSPAAGAGSPAESGGTSPASSPKAPSTGAGVPAANGGASLASSPKAPSAGAETPAADAGTPTSGARATAVLGRGASPAVSGGTTLEKSAGTQSNQLARTDNSGNASSPISGKTMTVGNSGVSTQSSNTPSKLPEAQSSSSKTSQSAASTETSGRSLEERTIRSGPLSLARSKVSESDTNASNGTSGAQNRAHHSVNGGGHSNPHGTSQSGGHGSGARGHSAHPHGYHSHGLQNAAGHGAQSAQAADRNDSSVYGIEQMRRVASELGFDQEDEVETLNHTFKQNWGGATRVRIGFAADRFMPYLAGGIAYGQFQDTVSISVKGEDGSVVSSKNLTDETKTMIGYTVGGGVDFAVLDNVIVRAEYRYSDFGKKKFAKEKLEVNYKTSDFRVGVAYKF